MSLIEDLQEKIAQRRDANEIARKKRNEDDAEEIAAAALADDERQLVELPGVSADYPGFVVLRRPTHAEYLRFRHIVERDRAATDTAEARAKITPDIGRSCVVWPPLPVYDAIVKAYPAIGEFCGNEALKAASAGAKAVAKK